MAGRAPFIKRDPWGLTTLLTVTLRLRRLSKRRSRTHSLSSAFTSCPSGCRAEVRSVWWRFPCVRSAAGQGATSFGESGSERGHGQRRPGAGTLVSRNRARGLVWGLAPPSEWPWLGPVFATHGRVMLITLFLSPRSHLHASQGQQLPCPASPSRGPRESMTRKLFVSPQDACENSDGFPLFNSKNGIKATLKRV